MVHDYGEAKNKFEDLLSYHDRPIILLGPGANGKTHLVREMRELGHMHSGWSLNSEYCPEACVDENGKSENQPKENIVYELRDAEALSLIDTPCYVLDMCAIQYTC